MQCFSILYLVKLQAGNDFTIYIYIYIHYIYIYIHIYIHYIYIYIHIYIYIYIYLYVYLSYICIYVFFYGKENFQKLFLNVGINICAWQQFNCFVLNLRLTGNTASCFCVLPLCRYIAFTWAFQRCYLALISSVQTYTT